MSTYNGEKYLREQLDSIIGQEKVSVAILIRDDGSKDSTIQIIEEYNRKYPDNIILEKGNNIGCRESFLWLMREAVDKYPNYDCYAFSDQDDVWLKRKLHVGAVAIHNSDAHYKLHFCAYKSVNNQLKPIEQKSYDYYYTLGEAFISQPCIGCSMMFNYDLLKEASLAQTSLFNYHDAWMYELAMSLGCDLLTESTEYMLYRQHDNNTIGTRQSFKARWMRRFHQFTITDNRRSKLAQYILENYESIISKDQKAILSNICDYRKSTKSKFILLTSSRYRSGKRMHNLLFKIAVVFNKI